MSHLIIEHIFVFMASLFIKQTKTKLSSNLLGSESVHLRALVVVMMIGLIAMEEKEVVVTAVMETLASSLLLVL